MIGLKIFLTGLVVLMAIVMIYKVFTPDDDNVVHIIVGLVAILASIAVFTGTLMMVWSL